MTRPFLAPRRCAAVSGALVGLAALAALATVPAATLRAAARAAVAAPQAVVRVAAEGVLAPPLPTAPRAYMVIIHREGLLNGLLNDLP
jgi:hypothetical protein